MKTCFVVIGQGLPHKWRDLGANPSVIELLHRGDRIETELAFGASLPPGALPTYRDAEKGNRISTRQKNAPASGSPCAGNPRKLMCDVNQKTTHIAKLPSPVFGIQKFWLSKNSTDHSEVPSMCVRRLFLHRKDRSCRLTVIFISNKRETPLND